MDNIDDLVYREITPADHNVEVKLLSDNAKLPTHGSAAAAGYDLYADLGDEEELIINAGNVKLVHTGISVKIPDNTFLALFARSGLSTMKGLRPANCVGVVDSDYRGEVMVALRNDTNGTQVIENGERIAQAILLPYIPMVFKEVNELDETERGDGSFGSTGNK